MGESYLEKSRLQSYSTHSTLLFVSVLAFSFSLFMERTQESGKMRSGGILLPVFVIPVLSLSLSL